MLSLGLITDDSGSTEAIIRRLVELGVVLVKPPFMRLDAQRSASTPSNGLDALCRDRTIIVQRFTPPVTLADAATVHLVLGTSVAQDQRSVIDVFIDGTATRTQLTATIDTLWHNRLVPFAANLHLGKRAPRRQKAVLVASDPEWSAQAWRLIARLRTVASHLIRKVDHIGSTSVSGLPAKDLLDIQVVVANLDEAAIVAHASRSAGFIHVSGAWHGTDRYGHTHPEHVLVDADPGRPVNINIRPVTAPIWRETLLFRDWLRTHPEGRAEYTSLKQSLAARANPDVNDYSNDKMPFISHALAQAEHWAADVNWMP